MLVARHGDADDQGRSWTAALLTYGELVLEQPRFSRRRFTTA